MGSVTLFWGNSILGIAKYQEVLLCVRKVTNLDTLNQAYQQRLTLLHGYIQPSVIQNKPTTKKKKTVASLTMNQSEEKIKEDNCSIAAIAEKAKTENLDVVALLKTVYKVVEVAI